MFSRRVTSNVIYFCYSEFIEQCHCGVQQGSGTLICLWFYCISCGHHDLQCTDQCGYAVPEYKKDDSLPPKIGPAHGGKNRKT